MIIIISKYKALISQGEPFNGIIDIKGGFNDERRGC
jgi:hypothetical protein